MTIAELFVSIGLTGSQKVGKDLTGISKGMSDVSTSSLAAKAAILGTIYGLERMTGWASQIGMDLHKFGVATGLSTQELQKWQHAGMLFDVSGAEMASTIANVQSEMTSLLTGEGGAQVLGLFSQWGVDLDPAKFRDAFYMMGKLQEFSKKAPPDISRHILKGIGINDNMLQFMKSSNLERDKGNSKYFVTPAQEKQLVRVNMAWKEFWFLVKAVGIQMVSMNTESFIKVVGLLSGAVKNIGGLLNDSLKGISSFMTDGEGGISSLIAKFPALTSFAVAAGAAIALAWAPVTTILVGILALMNDIQNFRMGKDSVIGKLADYLAPLFSGEIGAKAAMATPNNMAFPSQADIGRNIVPYEVMKTLTGVTTNATQAPVVNNNVTFNAIDPKDVDGNAKALHRVLQNTAGQYSQRGVK